MRNVLLMVIIINVLLSGCRKQPLVVGISSPPPLMIKSKPHFPIVPKVPLPFERCIDSYDELMGVLGTNQVVASAVILENGEIIRPGTDLESIVYEVQQQEKPNSLFDSRLIIAWRFPGGNWQLNISDVWSLGCVYEVAGQPPYTNLIKGGQVIRINTCFFWGTNVYTGERIAYLVID